MTNSQRLDAIRQHLQAWFAAQTDGQPWQVAESILIRDGFYCGRCFQLPGFRAIWFFEEDQVKLYRSGGELLETFSGTEIVSLPLGQSTLPIDQERERRAERQTTEVAAETRRAA